jgi:hypothetical protein
MVRTGGRRKRPPVLTFCRFRMHDAIFAEAFRPHRFTVLGVPLLDYTLGHEIVLQRMRNPLVTGDRTCRTRRGARKGNG